MTITNYKLPSFASARKALSTEQYRQYLQGLRLVDITLEDMACHANPEAISSQPAGFSVTVSRSFKCQEIESSQPALLLQYTVQGYQEEAKVLEIKATYRLHLEADAVMPVEFFSIYCNVSADMQVWPFLREMANSITGRMGVPRLALPLLLDPQSLNKPRRSPPPTGV
ncbi:MAG: hypothetical protein NT023_07520 [Armatimonadetes bacterium]|nr:hypothetical protein [Armatimonadota bacterium]